MRVIGLTGGLGAGKSTVARMFASLNVAVVDTDEMSHALTAPNGAALTAIRQAFGATVFQADGTLNRAALRMAILISDQAKHTLENILHPMIRDEVVRRLAQIHAAYALVVIPLLVETGAYDDLLERVLVVDCNEQTQLQRALSRGGWAADEIRAMMAKQADRAARLARADDVIDSEGDEASVVRQVAALHQVYSSDE
jgi:dephospho-CoA kinase